MKVQRKLFYLMVGGILSSLMACGSDKEAELVNTQTVEIGAVSKIVLDYDADDLLIKNSSSKKVVLEEYLNKDKRKYYSKVSKNGDTLSIQEGRRPIGTDFKSKMVLSLPKNYSDELRIHSTSGKVETHLSNKSMSSITLDTTSGKIYGDDLTADTIKLTTTSGLISSRSLTSKGTLRIKSTSGEIKLHKSKVKRLVLHTTSSKATLDELKGQVEYETKSGNLTVTDFSGAGEFTASGDGSLNLGVNHLADDLSVFSKNGAVTVSLPDSQTPQLDVKTKEGKVDNRWEGRTKKARLSTPRVTIETRNGDITVK